MVGIVGCGEIAQGAHTPSLLKIDSVKMVAVCDRDERRARRVAERFNINFGA